MYIEQKIQEYIELLLEIIWYLHTRILEKFAHVNTSYKLLAVTEPVTDVGRVAR